MTDELPPMMDDPWSVDPQPLPHTHSELKAHAQGRQAGKATLQQLRSEYLKGAVYVAVTNEYIWPDKSRVASDEVDQLSVMELNRRITSQSSRASSKPSVLKAGTRSRGTKWIFRMEVRVEDGTVVRWLSKDRYAYVAIKAKGRWFITGKGEWYGGNDFDHDQFLSLLRRPENSDIMVVHEWCELKQQ